MKKADLEKLASALDLAGFEIVTFDTGISQTFADAIGNVTDIRDNGSYVLKIRQVKD